MTIDEVEEGQIVELRPTNRNSFAAPPGSLAMVRGTLASKYVDVVWLENTHQNNGGYDPEDFVLYENPKDYDGKFA